jgi:hypothetical protein
MVASVAESLFSPLFVKAATAVLTNDHRFVKSTAAVLTNSSRFVKSATTDGHPERTATNPRSLTPF